MALPVKKNNNKGRIIGSIAVVGLGVGFAYVISKYIRRNIDGIIKKRREGKEYKDEQKGKLSFPPTQYKAWADGIQSAYDPYGTFGAGTDEDTIYNILRKLKTSDDWLQLQKDYGVRDYTDYTYNPFGTKTKLNLVESLNQELSGSEKNKINEILKSKNITYRI
jgi:hypothetical protein